MHTYGMKTHAQMYMEETTWATIRSQAEELGVPIGDLVDLYLRFAHSKVSAEALKKWASGRRSAKGRSAGGMRKSERNVLDAFPRLLAKGEGSWRFMATEIAREAGLTNKDAYFALLELQRRGLISGGGSQKEDRWGRPMESAWVLKGSEPQK